MLLSFDYKNMENTVFWDVAPCRYRVNRRFGVTYCLHLQGREILEHGFCSPEDGGAKLIETLMHRRSTRRHISEDTSRGCENSNLTYKNMPYYIKFFQIRKFSGIQNELN
jgi:hypothetical protein